MNDFSLCIPTSFVFKKGALEEVGPVLASKGFRSALLVYGQGSAVKNGIVNRVEASLEASGIENAALSGVRPNPEVSSVRVGIGFVKVKCPDIIIAIGGGSAIDCAKAIAVGAACEGDVWDIFDKKAPVPEDILPLAAVLTIPAAGSEASDSCVISNDELHLKRGINSQAIRPRFAFLDPEVTYTLPQYQTAAGVTDMIAHICERWFSGVGSVPVTDNIAAGVITAVMDAARVVKQTPNDYDARATLMWAGTLAHDGICGAGRNLIYGSRAGGWESHALEHELSAFDPSIAHGAGLAVMLPAWMRYVWQEDPERFLLFGQKVFGIEPVEEESFMGVLSAHIAPVDTERPVKNAVLKTIDALKSFFVEIGMPATLGELGLKPEDVDELIKTLEHNKGKEFGAFKKLTLEDAKAIYLSAF